MALMTKEQVQAAQAKQAEHETAAAQMRLDAQNALAAARELNSKSRLLQVHARTQEEQASAVQELLQQDARAKRAQRAAAEAAAAEAAHAAALAALPDGAEQ